MKIIWTYSRFPLYLLLAQKDAVSIGGKIKKTTKLKLHIMKYDYSIVKKEISGFGVGYEQSCRNMVIAGLEWLDQHPNADVSYKEYKNIYGLTTDESDDCKLMEQAMLSVNDGCSGAQMQASKSHIMYIHKNGWEKYVDEMNKRVDKIDEA